MTGTSGRQRVQNEALMESEIIVPPLKTQQKIASILSSKEDKIELNDEMNKTLEEIAQTLFKRWFVDFEFPNEKGQPYKSSGGKMVDNELGEIPDGWRVVNLDSKKEFGELIMGVSPKSSNYNTEYKGLPLLNGAADFDGTSLVPQKYSTELTRTVQDGDFVFCIRATIGLLTSVDREYVIGRGVLGLTKIKKEYKEYIYFFLKNSFNTLKQKATGSVILGLSKIDINGLKLFSFDEDLLNHFHKVSSNLLEQIEVNSKETQNLIKIRDTLLPKLMNGEIEV